MQPFRQTHSQCIDSRKVLLKEIANQLAARSPRWKMLFEIALIRGIKDWEMLEFLFCFDAGSSLEESSFPYARVAKLVATTEEWKVNQALTTMKDLVNWNRQAILAKIEEVKLKDFDNNKIERGYSTIQMINILYPEYVLK